MKNGEDTDRVEYSRGNRELARTDTTSGTRRNANNKILVISLNDEEYVKKREWEKILKEGMVRRSEFDCIVIHVQIIFRHFEKQNLPKFRKRREKKRQSNEIGKRNESNITNEIMERIQTPIFVGRLHQKSRNHQEFLANNSWWNICTNSLIDWVSSQRYPC